MFKLVREYFENEEYESEIVAENKEKSVLVDKFEELIQADEKFGYIVDSELNEYDEVRLFLGADENWDNYIEMRIIEDNTNRNNKEHKLDREIKELVNAYDDMSYSDFNACLLAMETEYGIHYQELFNKVAEKYIRKRINNFVGSRTINNEEFIFFIRELENRFECDIDLIDLSITPHYQ